MFRSGDWRPRVLQPLPLHAQTVFLASDADTVLGSTRPMTPGMGLTHGVRLGPTVMISLQTSRPEHRQVGQYLSLTTQLPGNLLILSTSMSNVILRTGYQFMDRRASAQVESSIQPGTKKHRSDRLAARLTQQVYLRKSSRVGHEAHC